MGKEQNNIPEFLRQMIDSEIPKEKRFIDSSFIDGSNEKNVNMPNADKEYVNEQNGHN